MKDIKLKKLLPSILATIKKLPWFLGKYAFWFILLLIVADVLFGVAIFYNYIFLVKMEEPEIAESPATFKEDVYQQIINNWQLRSQKLESGQNRDFF